MMQHLTEDRSLNIPSSTAKMVLDACQVLKLKAGTTLSEDGAQRNSQFLEMEVCRALIVHGSFQVLCLFKHSKGCESLTNTKNMILLDDLTTFFIAPKMI